MSQLALKLVHSAAVVLFMGNIITGLFWAAHARRTKDLRIVAVIFDGIIRSDRWFTLPCVAVILVSGLTAAGRLGLPVLGTGWLLWSSFSFAISGILFGGRVAPLQRKIRDLAGTAEGTPENWQAFERMYRQWELFGIASVAAVVAPFVLMVLQVPLPSW